MSGDDLFSMADERSGRDYAPLAVRMRPESLDDIYGQDDLIGPGSFLRTLIEKDTIPSLLFYGPSGVGKTTLAHVIANETDSRFVTLNAVTAGTAELRKVIAAAQDAIHLYQKRTILFIDEIHRFNKSQQDVLLPYVEDGTVILIGATTENPYFEVNRPLLSRLRVIQLTPLPEQAVMAVLRRALIKKKAWARWASRPAMRCWEPWRGWPTAMPASASTCWNRSAWSSRLAAISHTTLSKK